MLLKRALFTACTAITTFFFALPEIATAADLDDLLATGSCFNCVIENADLGGRVLNFNRIENTRFSHVNFRGTAFSARAMASVTIESSDLSGASFSVTDLADSLLQDLNLRAARVAIRNLDRVSIRRIDMSSATVAISRLTDSQFSDFTGQSTRWSVSTMRDVAFERAQLNQSSLALGTERVRFSAVSCKSCIVTLGEPPQGGDMEFSGADLTRASVSYPRTMNVIFAGGTNLDHAALNQQVCAAGSMDRCI